VEKNISLNLLLLKNAFGWLQEIEYNICKKQAGKEGKKEISLSLNIYIYIYIYI
jgi:hypothetical protein